MDIPPADRDNRLAVFAGNPMAYTGPEADDWETVLGPMIKTAFGWGEEENRMAIKEMIQRGEYGLDGFHNFLKHFVIHRGLKGGLFEAKVKIVIEELDSMCVSLFAWRSIVLTKLSGIRAQHPRFLRLLR